MEDSFEVKADRIVRLLLFFCRCPQLPKETIRLHLVNSLFPLYSSSHINILRMSYFDFQFFTSATGVCFRGAKAIIEVDFELPKVEL